MEKTKLGISVGFMGAILYCLGLFSGYFITVAAVAYVLFCEENEWLRKTAVKVVVLTFLFPIIHKVIGFIPDLANFVADIINVFNGWIDLSIISNLEAVLRDVVNVAHYLIFMLLGFLALFQKPVQIPLVDSFLDKHMK